MAVKRKSGWRCSFFMVAGSMKFEQFSALLWSLKVATIDNCLFFKLDQILFFNVHFKWRLLENCMPETEIWNHSYFNTCLWSALFPYELYRVWFCNTMMWTRRCLQEALRNIWSTMAMPRWMALKLFWWQGVLSVCTLDLTVHRRGTGSYRSSR